jgi:hypothetical protein
VIHRLVAVVRSTYGIGRERPGPKAEPVLSAEQDELASIAGLEARRRTFTVLFHDLGKSSACGPAGAG